MSPEPRERTLELDRSLEGGRAITLLSSPLATPIGPSASFVIATSNASRGRPNRPRRR